MNNGYYEIACNDFYFFRDCVNINYCNQFTVQAQQIAEKMLKSVAELTCTGIEKLMNSHNLKALYGEIAKIEPSIVLSRAALAELKDYYFDAKYPGVNYTTVTIEELRDATDTMLNIVCAVNDWRQSHGLPIMPEAPREELRFLFEEIDEKLAK